VIPEEVSAALDRAERALDAGTSVRGTGFWAAVGAARRDRDLADRYADRIAAIDRRAFEAGVKLRVPAWIGIAVLLAGTLVGFGAIYVAFWGWGGPLCGFVEPCEPSPLWASIVFLGGFAALIVCTHCLAHWVVGRAVGIRFTHVFLGGPPPPRPGLKSDYATYLRASPRARALMHASGAIVTKLIPFAFLVPGLIWFFDWNWLMWLLLIVGVTQIVTDLFLSTKVSDWKKVKRELEAAKRARSTS